MSKNKKIYDLERLFGSVIAQSAEGDFAFDKICKFFGASSGTFWKLDNDTEEYDAVDFFNRPNRLLGDQEYSFNLDENSQEGLSLATNYVFDSGEYVIKNIGNYPFDEEWKKKEIVKDILIYKKICVLPIYSNSDIPIASLSLYGDDFKKIIYNKIIVKEFSNFLSLVLTGPARYGEKVVSERMKISHEIKRQLHILGNKILDSKKRLTGDNDSNYQVLRDFDDMNSILKTSMSSISELKFIEGVIKRKNRAKKTNFRLLHNTISSSMKKDAKGMLNTALTMQTDDFLLWVAKSDLDLIISNLIENAIKYNIVGGYITASVSTHGKKIKYTIRNLSEQLSEAEQRKLWLHGKRGSNAHKIENVKKIPGTGIGLSVISDICKIYDIDREFEQIRSTNNEKTFWSEVSLVFPEKMITFPEK